MQTTVTPQTTKIIITALVVVLLFSITLYQARFYLQGPQIDIAQNNLVTSDPSINVSFIVRNATEVNMSGRQVIPQVSGLVSQKLFLQPGENIFLIHAQDTYGTVEKEYLYITYPQ